MPATQVKPTQATLTVVERAVESIEAFTLAIITLQAKPDADRVAAMADVKDARDECTAAFTDLCVGTAPALHIVR